MNESHPKLSVAVRASNNGQYTYQIFVLAGEPRTFRCDNKSYDTPEEAAQAGYDALAIFTTQSQ